MIKLAKNRPKVNVELTEIEKVSENGKQYGWYFPKEMERILYAMSSRVRIVILGYLLVHEEATFSQLLAALGLSPSTLDWHLKILSRAALVENYYKKTESKEYSHYHASELCRGTLRRLGISEPELPAKRPANRLVSISP